MFIFSTHIFFLELLFFSVKCRKLSLLCQDFLCLFFFLISPAVFQFVFAFLIRLFNSQIVLLFIITVVYRLLLFLCLCKIICVFIASQLCQVFSFSFPRAVQFLSRLLNLLWKTLTLNIFFFCATFTFSVHSCQ